MVQGEKECRRLGLNVHMDGKGKSCLSLRECVWCDVCSEAMRMTSDEEDRVNEEVEENEEV